MKTLTDIIKEVPPALKSAPSDYVSWSAKDDQGKEHGHWKYTACYSPIMPKLGDMDVHCRPHTRNVGMYGDVPANTSREKLKASRLEGRLSAEQYLHFVQLAREAGIFHEEMEFTHNFDYGNCMFIPKGKFDRHTVYMALVVYRWLDSKPVDMWATVLLSERRKLPLLQCLYYTAAVRGWSAGHSIFFFTRDACKNPALGWAWAKYNSLTLGERQEKKAGQTYELLHNLSTTLNPNKGAGPQPAGASVGIYNYKPVSVVQDIEQLLDPRLSTLFTHPNQINPEEFQKLVQGIADEKVSEPKPRARKSAATT